MSPINLSILLLLINYCSCDPIPPSDETRINAIARKGDMINDIIVPKLNGKLGDGSYGFVWQGFVNFTPVALKFVPKDDDFQEEIDREHKLFEVLGAIKNEDIENYGVPCIYYRGIVFDKFDTVAMTLLGHSLDEKKKNFNNPTTIIDILLIYQKCIRILKFIHGKGIIHQDIKTDNVLFRGAEVFIIDFNLSQLVGKEEELCDGGTPVFASLNGHKGLVRNEMDDFESLFYTMLAHVGVELPWDIEEIDYDEYEAYKESDYQIRVVCCEQIKSDILKKVFLDFYAEYKSGQTVPKYNENYYKIDQIIRSITKTNKQAYFSWLTAKEIAQAKSNPLPSIESIIGPKPRKPSPIPPYQPSAPDENPINSRSMRHNSYC